MKTKIMFVIVYTLNALTSSVHASAQARSVHENARLSKISRSLSRIPISKQDEIPVHHNSATKSAPLADNNKVMPAKNEKSTPQSAPTSVTRLASNPASMCVGDNDASNNGKETPPTALNTQTSPTVPTNAVEYAAGNDGKAKARGSAVSPISSNRKYTNSKIAVATHDNNHAASRSMQATIARLTAAPASVSMSAQVFSTHNDSHDQEVSTPRSAAQLRIADLAAIPRIIRERNSAQNSGQATPAKSSKRIESAAGNGKAEPKLVSARGNAHATDSAVPAAAGSKTNKTADRSSDVKADLVAMAAAAFACCDTDNKSSKETAKASSEKEKALEFQEPSESTQIAAEWARQADRIAQELGKTGVKRAFFKVLDASLNRVAVRAIVYQEHKARLIELFKTMHKDKLPNSALCRNEAALERKAAAITNDLLLSDYVTEKQQFCNELYDNLGTIIEDDVLDDAIDSKHSIEVHNGELSKFTKITAVWLKESKAIDRDINSPEMNQAFHKVLHPDSPKSDPTLSESAAIFTMKQERRERLIDLFIDIYKRTLPYDPLSANNKALKRKAREITDDTLHFLYYAPFNVNRVFSEHDGVISYKQDDQLHNQPLSTETMVMAQLLSQISTLKERVRADKRVQHIASKLQEKVARKSVYHLELVERLIARYVVIYKRIEPIPSNYSDDWVWKRARETILSLGSPSDYWHGKLDGMDHKS